MQDQQPQICFVIGPIDEDGSAVRDHSDKLLRHIIEPIARDIFNYDVIRADMHDSPGIITLQIFQFLLTAPLVIADLTGSNPNVFYEAGIRHAVNKPIVLVAAKDQRLPFDVGQNRTIFVNLSDLDNVEDCRLRLKNQIRAIQDDPSDFDNPVQLTADYIQLRSSDEAYKQSTAQIIETLDNQAQKFNDFEQRFQGFEHFVRFYLDETVKLTMGASGRFIRTTDGKVHEIEQRSGKWFVKGTTAEIDLNKWNEIMSSISLSNIPPEINLREDVSPFED